MKFALDHEGCYGWQLTLEGSDDLIVDLLQTYCGGDHEQALDLFESAERTGDPGRYRMTVDLADCNSEQDAARALLDILTATPGFSHG